jgi:hypothetical protein
MDMTRWLRLQLNGGTLEGSEVVSEDALVPTHMPHIAIGPPGTYDGQTASYGLGWIVVTDHLGYLRWGHSGGFDRGASTNATLLPTEGLGVVALTNGMPIGVPEALADEIIDQIATGGQTRDWHEYWTEHFAGTYLDDPALSELPDPPTPARAADAYLGSYANDFYGTFEIVGDGATIALVEGPERVTFPLTHWDADTFTYAPVPENPGVRATVTFTIGPDGRAASINIGDFDGAGLGTLNRI